jgi:PAS domain S-box-containing protein
VSENQQATVEAAASNDYRQLSKSELSERLDHLLGQPVGKWRQDEVQYLLHELQVHQIELELQNRALRESQHALEESRDRYADLYDFAPVGYLTLSDKAVILELNLRAASLLGRERSRLIGSPLIPRLEQGESRVLLNHLSQAFKSDSKVVHEVRLRTADGEPRVVRMQSLAVKGAKAEARTCHTAMIDVTAQRQTENALRKSDEQFRTIFDQAAVGVARINSRNGRFNQVNKKFSDILGYSVPELQAMEMMQVCHPRDLPRILLKVKKVLRHEVREFSREMRVFRKNGEIVWLNLTVSSVWGGDVVPDYYIAIIEDISQRKYFEAILEGRGRVLKTMAKGATLDDVLLQLVSSVEELNSDIRCAVLLLEGDGNFRVAAAPGLPDDFDQLVHSESAETNFPCCNAVVASNEVEVVEDILTHTQYEAYHSIAEKIGVRACWAVPVLSNSGQALGLFATFHREARTPTRADLDLAEGSAQLAGIAIERLHSELQARQHLDELAHIARLNMMGEMATGLAHELNQPLAAITTYVDIARRKLRDSEPDPEMVEQALQGTRDQALRANSIIRHLRQLVRKQPSQMVKTDLNELIVDVVEMLHFELQKTQVKLGLQLKPDLPHIVVDAIQLEQVFMNLLGNSMEAMENVAIEKRVVNIMSSIRDDAMVLLSITDTGPGIDEATMAHLFEPFVTTKGAAGMGMGLSISRSIIEAHGGQLWAESVPGQGATFNILLPQTGTRG